jgi:hypothetical protein
MEDLRTLFGDYKVIPFKDFDDLTVKWKDKDTFSDSMWRNAKVFGIINGKRNRNLITVDVDTKQDATGTLSQRVLEGLKYTFPQLHDEFYIETTKSKGLHIMFHLDESLECPAKSTPAKTLNAKGAKIGLIEILGEGQQTFTHPSPSYDIIQGSIDEIPTISKAHYDEVIKFCKLFNEIPEEVQSIKPDNNECPKKGRSGDIYNVKVEPKEVVNVLTQNGWEVVREVEDQFFLRRPDKEQGISATFNYGHRKQLIVFSTSTEFVSHHDDGSYIGYSPFQILTKLRFKGNFKACAKHLDSAGYKDDNRQMWGKLQEAFDIHGTVGMRKAIPPEYVVTLSSNQLVDFMDELKEKFGDRCITKSYLNQIKKDNPTGEEGEDNGIDDASDQSCFTAMSETYDGCFGINEFNGSKPHITQQIPDIADKIPEDGLQLTDRHERNIWFQLMMKYGHSFSKETISSIIDVMAQDNPYHPVQRKLNGLKWDEKPRLESWLIDYCGAKDCREVRQIAKYFMVGAVARTMVAGCKMDNALILKSAKQGIGKSELVNILSYGYSTDDLGAIGSKDCSEKLQGNWIVELPELDNLRTASKEKVKYWLSTRHDDEVLKYEKRITTRPRQCVFIGTTNEDSLFAEEEFRRFWPVEVTKIDMKGLKKDRDQLWAEAVHMYNNGQKWWSVDPSEFQEYAEDSREGHPHEDEIIEYLEGRTETTSKLVHFAIYGATSRSRETYSPSAMREYTPILRKLGFKKQRGKWVK